MIKLMIADDEAGIRRGLRHYVDWMTWDIQLVAEAKDGDEAYRRAIETQPDILLSDIRMPGRDGIQLAKDLRNVLPSLRVILLSGYSDTEYLQTALQMGVKDYLLKPAGAEKIIESVLKVKDEIVAERSQHQERLNKDALLNEGIPILQMHFLNDLLGGRLTRQEEMLIKAKRLKIPMHHPWLQILSLRTGESESHQFRSDKEHAMDQWQLNRNIHLVLEKYEESFFIEMEPELFLILCGAESQKAVEACSFGLAQDVVEELSKKAYPYLAVGIGEAVENIQDLKESFQTSRQALKQWAWNTDIRIFRTPCPANEKLQQEARKWEQEAAQAIKQELYQDSLNDFEKMFSAYKAGCADLDEVKESCSRLLVLASHWKREDESPETGDELNTDLAHVEVFLDAESLREWMHQQLSSLVSGERQHISPLVSKAQEYIRKNYAENITLQNLAPELFVSPNYLGRLFREQTGYKLGDWLNKHRVEVAKTLLEDPNIKTYEVATKVGFSSYKYFSVCFLKYAGSSAREYRNRYK